MTSTETSLQRARRVRSSVRFGEVIRRGVRVADRLLQLWASPNQRDTTRLGIIVSRRHGNAVQRNRLKRILREAFRHQRVQLPAGLDLICRPQLGKKLRRDETAEALQKLAERAAAQLAKQKRASS